jgi:hypothetical protein
MTQKVMSCVKVRAGSGTLGVEIFRTSVDQVVASLIYQITPFRTIITKRAVSTISITIASETGMRSDTRNIQKIA